MPQEPPRNLRELQELGRNDGPMLAASGISRWAQRRAQSIRERAGSAEEGEGGREGIDEQGAGSAEEGEGGREWGDE